MLYGVAAAATQIEGCETNNNWYRWFRQGHIADGADPSVATMHWERWREDTALARDMGLVIYRMGLEWSRIEPERGRFDEAVLERYREELALLRSYGIRPLVTLWHFSNPLWFEDMGGFLHPEAEAIFLEYVEKVVEALGDLAESWVTLNEPNVYAVNGYLFGLWPPGEKNVFKALKIMEAFVPLHRKAYDLLHRRHPAAKVSFALHMRPFDPLREKNVLDRLAAKVMDYFFQKRMTARMLRGGKYDYIGLNYYTRSYCTIKGEAPPPKGRPVNDLGWEIYPEGLVRCVKELHGRWGKEVYITENGTCDNDDRFRCRYLYEHLKALQDSGLPAARYYHWCFCDNWEWAEGASARFGLVHTNYETQERNMKKSGQMMMDIIRSGGVTEEIFRRYVDGEEYTKA